MQGFCINVMPAVWSDPIEVTLGDGREEHVHGARRVGGEVVARDGEVGKAEHGQAVVDKVPAEELVDEVKLLDKQGIQIVF